MIVNTLIQSLNFFGKASWGRTLIVLFLMSACTFSLAEVLGTGDELSVSEVFKSRFFFKIEVGEEKSEWESCSDVMGDFQQKKVQYHFTLSNQSAVKLRKVRGSYCLYLDRGEFVERELFDVLDATDIGAGEVLECFSRRMHMSVRRPSIIPSSFHEVVGIRARFVITMDDGTDVVREITHPKSLSEKKYPWKELVDTSSLPDPTVYPDKKMTEEQVEDIAKAYVKAIEDQDVGAWVAMLSPMHPGDEKLDETDLLELVCHVRSVDIENIAGLNVMLKITLDILNGREFIMEGYLQIHDSGYIKYTPFVFNHPVLVASKALRSLWSDNVTYRQNVVPFLKRLGVPMFNYDANASKEERDAEAHKIFIWFLENGATHDVSEPNVLIPSAEFQECMEYVRSFGH